LAEIAVIENPKLNCSLMFRTPNMPSPGTNVPWLPPPFVEPPGTLTVLELRSSSRSVIPAKPPRISWSSFRRVIPAGFVKAVAASSARAECPA
jgi:hypothetical protein